MSNRKRVAIIGTRGFPSYYGGFETLLRHLVPFLADRNWDVDVYCRTGGTTAREVEEPAEDGHGQITQIFTRGVESKSASTLSFGLTSCFDAARRKPDVALVMNVANGFWLPLLRAKRISTAVNVDGIEWDRDKWGPTAKRVFRTGAHLTARYADELVFDALEIGRRWESDFRRSGVFIPYGGTPSADLPAEASFPRGKYVLYVARFVPENSVHQFIDAAHQLSQRTHVVIVGSSGYGGPIEDKVKAAADENSNITWLGHISDDRQLHALWSNAGAYFHGHSVGGTNPALVQAMACGAPVIARDTPYNREVLGQAALYARPEPQHIVEQISRVLDDDTLRINISSDAQARQATNYTWDLVCARYEATLQNLADGRTFRSTAARPTSRGTEFPVDKAG